ncbi:MAG TPA: cytochrome ubiquinol oxidase subunit I [Verrucomicrobiae bacterium]|nr:cytochrome ubiquinol oxidase subunit I [Verrucomicrobiae bacterium]
MGLDNVIWARAQMGMSLAFHIIFAAIGMAMPLMMAVAEGVYLRTKSPVHLELSKRWAKGTAILFAVGAVSGTVLSFELGLLWPEFMEHAGAIIGMPFSLEGFAFFTEAIFLGLFLYGWNRLNPVAHWLAGVVVAVSGIFSGIFVVLANAWMNTPAGFKFVDGKFTEIDPVGAMFSPAALHEVLHMIFSVYVATGFMAAAIHAYFLLRNRASEFHRAAFKISAGIACVCIVLQVVTGDLAARRVAKLQPAKLAAMEAHYRTIHSAPLIVGGIPDSERMTVRYGVEIPNGLSLLVARDPRAEVAGLDQYPRDQWPNVTLVHWAFDIMVGTGFVMLAVALWAGWKVVRRKRVIESRAMLKVFVLTGPLGFIALEAGWMVTELGRQPWIIYGIMRTRDAVTPMPGLIIPFLAITFIYIFLSVIVIVLLRRQFVQTAP